MSEDEVRKIAIVGSRTILDKWVVDDAVRNSPWIGDDSPNNWGVEFVSGGADGVDTSAEVLAQQYGISIEIVKPDYDDWSRGHPAKVRNTRIVEKADAIIAVWDGMSNGTRDTVDKALDRGVPVYVEVVG